MIELYYSLKLRHFSDQALMEALELLEKNRDQSIAREVTKSKLRIAKELIRRQIVFW